MHRPEVKFKTFSIDFKTITVQYFLSPVVALRSPCGRPAVALRSPRGHPVHPHETLSVSCSDTTSLLFISLCRNSRADPEHAAELSESGDEFRSQIENQYSTELLGVIHINQAPVEPVCLQNLHPE